MSESGSYWFCVKHHKVESGGDLCPPIDRLGPFESREAASHALEKAEERNQEWDNDPQWNDDQGNDETLED